VCVCVYDSMSLQDTMTDDLDSILWFSFDFQNQCVLNY